MERVGRDDETCNRRGLWWASASPDNVVYDQWNCIRLNVAVNMHALPNFLMSKRCLHVFHRSIIQSKCNSRLAHRNTLCQFNSSPQLRPFSSLPARIATPVTATSISSLPTFLQFARTQLRNATHRDLLRFRYSSSRRPPRRPNWLDSINGNTIFVAIIAINAGVFLLWQGAKSTYVRTGRYALIKTEV
jgi:hypothetical protein